MRSLPSTKLYRGWLAADSSPISSFYRNYPVGRNPRCPRLKINAQLSAHVAHAAVAIRITLQICTFGHWFSGQNRFKEFKKLRNLKFQPIVYFKYHFKVVVLSWSQLLFFQFSLLFLCGGIILERYEIPNTHSRASDPTACRLIRVCIRQLRLGYFSQISNHIKRGRLFVSVRKTPP